MPLRKGCFFFIVKIMRREWNGVDRDCVSWLKNQFMTYVFLCMRILVQVPFCSNSAFIYVVNNVLVLLILKLVCSMLVLDVDNSYDKKEPHYSQLTLNAYKPLSHFAIIVSEDTDSSLPNRTFLEIL